MAVGDLVVVVDPANLRNVWPKGKFIEINMSEDGQVRRAKAMTASGVLETAAVKLAILARSKLPTTDRLTAGECCRHRLISFILFTIIIYILSITFIALIIIIIELLSVLK